MTCKAILKDYERLNLSMNENPRFSVELEIDGAVRTFTTVSDGMLSYRLENFKRGDVVTAFYHTTKSGFNRLDDLEYV